MSLYLCVFDGEREVAGLEIGSYADFGAFRASIATFLEHGSPGSRFPTLMLHSDCDGAWTPDDCVRLERELLSISQEGCGRPEIAGARDVDGEPLLDRLGDLARVALERSRPILFQ